MKYESYATQDFFFGKLVENNYNFRVEILMIFCIV